MATYYVTTSGSGGNSGSSEGDAWSLSHAFSNVAAGDTVYVKAGNYGALQLTLNTNGTSSNRIRFEGYINSPGDIVSNGVNSFIVDDSYDTAFGPAIVGTRTNLRPDQNVGIVINGDYVDWVNFQHYAYNVPFRITGINCLVQNLKTATSGTHNPADLGTFSSTFPDGAYTGYGIVADGADDIEIRDCQIVDAGAEGIRIVNLLRPRAYNTNVRCIKGVGGQGNFTGSNGNGTDYHWLIGSNTSDGYFENIGVFHSAAQAAPGHGICFKPTFGNFCTDHEVNGFVVENSLLETQFPEVQRITYRNGIVRDTNGFQDDRSEATGANISNGSSFVTIENVIFENSRFRSSGWNESIYPDNPGYNKASVNCTVKDCLFYNTAANKLKYSAWSVSYSVRYTDLYATENLTFDHCTVYDYPRLWEVDKPNSNITINNCIFDDMPVYSVVRINDGGGPLIGTDGPYSLDTTYTTCNFSNGFAAQPGTNITTSQPQFTNPAAGDFTLQPASPLKGQSTATANFPAGLDLGYLGGSGPGDTTPPNVTSINVDEITDNSFRVTWSLDEGSTGQIFWDTVSVPGSTPTSIASDYSNNTGKELSYLTTHIQRPGPLNGGALPSNTIIYWRTLNEDAAGNQSVSAEQSTVTLALPPPSDGPAYTLQTPALGTNKIKRYLGSTFLTRTKTS